MIVTPPATRKHSPLDAGTRTGSDCERKSEALGLSKCRRQGEALLWGICRIALMRSRPKHWRTAMHKMDNNISDSSQRHSKNPVLGARDSQSWVLDSSGLRRETTYWFWEVREDRGLMLRAQVHLEERRSSIKRQVYSPATVGVVAV